MKKLLLIFLFTIPLLARAQENLILRSRAQVSAYFKKIKVPLNSTDNSGKLATDEYKSGDGESITCFFNKANICKKELDVTTFASMAKIKANLKRDWVAAGDNLWTNKAKTVKVHLIPVEPLGQLYVMFAAFDESLGK